MAPRLAISTRGTRRRGRGGHLGFFDTLYSNRSAGECQRVNLENRARTAGSPIPAAHDAGSPLKASRFDGPGRLLDVGRYSHRIQLSSRAPRKGSAPLKEPAGQGPSPYRDRGTMADFRFQQAGFQIPVAKQAGIAESSSKAVQNFSSSDLGMIAVQILDLKLPEFSNLEYGLLESGIPPFMNRLTHPDS